MWGFHPHEQQYGAYKEVSAAYQQGFTTGSVSTWLQVIPQIIARMDAPSKPVRRLIYDLLVYVGREHPLVFHHWIFLRMKHTY